MLRPILLLALFTAVVGLMAIPSYVGSVNSNIARQNGADSQKHTQRGQLPELPLPYATRPVSAILNFLSPPPPSPPSIATYGDAGCTVPQSVFNLANSEFTVCAKVTGGQVGQHILWSNANFTQVQNTPLGTGESTFTLSGGSSLGDWRVILYEPLGGSVYAVTPFTVVDAANPTADLAVFKTAVTSPVSAGSQVVFEVHVTNYGPSDATNVQVSDPLPANTTNASFALVSGPGGFNCAVVDNDVTCTAPTLAKGETAIFTASYDVLAGTPSGTVISNTATVSTTTEGLTDPRSANDSSTGTANVTAETAATCTLDCPANVVVTSNTTQGGQPGAFVSFGAASATGDCGSISNSPASGSFFTVGTHSVISTSAAGPTCSFSVTVLDTAAPTIMCPPPVTATAPAGSTEFTLPIPEGQTNGTGTPTINASGGGIVTFVRSDNKPAEYDDNGNEVTPAVIHDVTDPYPIGTTGILWTVTDAGGRTKSCSQTVTIVLADARPAITISCPANVSVSAPANSCSATVAAETIGTPTTNLTDSNVDVVAVRSDGQSLSDPFPAGTTLITWTATDNLGGTSASCAQSVTVTISNTGDTTPPTLTVPANVFATTSSCTATLDDELGTAEATDPVGACNGSVTITRTGVPANFIFPTGTTTIIYTATDAAGNTSTGVQLVTVTESPAIPPTITAPNDVIAYTGAGATSCGTVVSDATLGTATASDNCSLASVTRTGVPAGNVFPKGTTTVTYRATDASGNFTEDTQLVTVIDNTPPAISCPASITLEPTCPTGAIATWTAPVGTDNCPGAVTTRTAGGAPGSVFAIGTTTVTYSVTDASGNGPVSCSFTVKVLTPQAVIQNLIAAVNASSLTGTQKNGLLAKLNAALNAINGGQTNVACNKLSEFVNNVGNLINQGTLTAAQGNAWISSANHVRNTIGCTNLPCS
jgi:uncharacterized repeat protein (TIGR01451 family)